ncbi:MAG TPA: hypothetical protein VMV10_00285 [Pirellulales bacterium]|nr:hypothetical protein [Pirellulales bacterium]
MCSLMLFFCWVGAPGADPAGHANAVLEQLVETGIALPDAGAVKLPPPSMPDGLDAKQQRTAIAKLPGIRHSVEDLLRKSAVAPFELQKTQAAAKDKAETSAWRVDAWFVAYGELDQVAKEDFLKRWSQLGGGKDENGGVSRAGKLSDEEIAERKLFDVGGDHKDEYFLYSTFELFDKVQFGATRHAMISRSDESLLVAARVDSRFAGDAKYPNQWRPMKRDELGKITVGQPHPYEAAGFYAKVTRLEEPAGALFVEYHQVFNEPQAWFHGARLLSSKIPLLAQDAVRDFRRKLIKENR